MELMILGHVLGDFYLQSNELAKRKVDKLQYLILHGFLYTLPIGLAMCVFDNAIKTIMIMLISIMIVHIVIDWIKIKLEKKYIENQCVIFVIDQMIHIVILYLFMHVGEINSAISLDLIEIIEVIDIGILISVFICWKPASIFTALFMQEMLPKEDDLVQKEKVKIGALIGKLEREIILLLGIAGQFGAVGLVLTAKSLARYKQLEEQSFAEKYLVGTLVSTLIAVLCVIAINVK